MRKKIYQIKFKPFSISDKENKRWVGSARIPLDYFPPNFDKFNAYAINNDSESGKGNERVYRALHPVPGESADFHRLTCFQSVHDRLLEDFAKAKH